MQLSGRSADFARQRPVAQGVQPALLSPAAAARQNAQPFHALFLSAGSDPRMEPDLWPQRLLPISMRVAARGVEGRDRRHARRHRGLGDRLLSRGAEDFRRAERRAGCCRFHGPARRSRSTFPIAARPRTNCFARLDSVTREAGGALYPAKDARMPGEMFRRGYPDWETFSSFVDPGFSSGFWRRVTQQQPETGAS